MAGLHSIGLPWISALMAAAAAAAMVIIGRRRVRGTTLTAPVWWTAGSLLALAGTECFAAAAADIVWLSHLRFMAASTTLCPIAALLGAKRPQDRGWQFVVLSLWGVLAFFALTELAFRPHRPLEMHFAVRWLLIAPLLAMGLVNYLFTRHALPAALAAAGQLLLLSPQLPEIACLLPESLVLGSRAGDAIALTGIVMLSGAVGLMFIIPRRDDVARRTGPTRNRESEADRGSPSLARQVSVQTTFDRAWLDFRDQFGAFWGLRVALRFNRTAEQLGWRVWLGWRGLDVVEPDQAGATDPSMRQALRSLLLRFVDEAWLDEHGLAPRETNCPAEDRFHNSRPQRPIRSPTSRPD